MKFVYCVDENFNFQLATSIFSLLNNVNREITIYVLHENPDTFNNFKLLLQVKALLATLVFLAMKKIKKEFIKGLQKHIQQ